LEHEGRYGINNCWMPGDPGSPTVFNGQFGEAPVQVGQGFSNTGLCHTEHSKRPGLTGVDLKRTNQGTF
jgi:hypothetical protein